MPPNILTAALNSVFGPIVKQSAKWPPILAQGLPGIIAVFLIIALGVVVPLSLALLLALVILAPVTAFIVLDWNARRRPIVAEPGRSRPGATIDFPRSNSSVDPTIYCTGFASGIQSDVHVWLAVEALGFTWPKELEVFVTRDGRWNHTIFEDGAAKKFSVVLLIANSQGDKIIRDWLEAGKAKGEYAEIKGIPGANRLARVDNLQIQ